MSETCIYYPLILSLSIYMHALQHIQTYCNLEDTTSRCKSQHRTKAFREVWKQSKSSKAKDQQTLYSISWAAIGIAWAAYSCIRLRKSTESFPLSALQVAKSIPNAVTIGISEQIKNMKHGRKIAINRSVFASWIALLLRAKTAHTVQAHSCLHIWVKEPKLDVLWMYLACCFSHEGGSTYIQAPEPCKEAAVPPWPWHVGSIHRCGQLKHIWHMQRLLQKLCHSARPKTSKQRTKGKTRSTSVYVRTKWRRDRINSYQQSEMAVLWIRYVRRTRRLPCITNNSHQRPSTITSYTSETASCVLYRFWEAAWSVLVYLEAHDSMTGLSILSESCWGTKEFYSCGLHFHGGLVPFCGNVNCNFALCGGEVLPGLPVPVVGARTVPRRTERKSLHIIWTPLCSVILQKFGTFIRVNLNLNLLAINLHNCQLWIVVHGALWHLAMAVVGAMAPSPQIGAWIRTLESYGRKALPTTDL